jgi:hypothetical protein
VKGNIPFRQFIQIIVFFSLTTPIGAGLGLGLSSFLDSLQSVLSESVKAIASGMIFACKDAVFTLVRYFCLCRFDGGTGRGVWTPDK